MRRFPCARALMDHTYPPHSLTHVHRLKPGHTSTHALPRALSSTPVPIRTLLCIPLSWELPILPLPSASALAPTPPSSPSLLTPHKVQLSCQPRPLHIIALGPGPFERKKERKQEEKQKERGKQKNETELKGQWCLELSHCITMNMDSIKLRSAC